MSYRFRWTCSFFGCQEFEVLGDGPAYKIEVRRVASDYERSIFNGDEAEWQRDVVAAIDLLRRSGNSDWPIAPEVAAAFNAWLEADHQEQATRILSQPERYGAIAADDPLLVAPRPVRAAHYRAGQGWIAAEPTPSRAGADS